MSSQMTEQLVEAAVLLGVGMSVVFVFLTMLIGGIHIISWYCRKFPSPEAISVQHPTNQQQDTHNKNNKSPTSVNPQIAAAISAAVHAHRHTTLNS